MPKFIEFTRRSGGKRVFINPEAVAGVTEYSSVEGDGGRAATVIWLMGVEESRTVLGSVDEVLAKLEGRRGRASSEPLRV